MTNSLSVTLHILWKVVWSYIFLQPTGSEWHCTFCERESHHIFSYNHREWVTLHNLWKVIWSYLFLWPTASEWHCTFCERQSHHIFSYDQQFVSDIQCTFCERQSAMIISLWVTLHILWKAVWSYVFLWPTGSERDCTFCERQPDHIFSSHQ